jgi:GH35 family endo-1,4-beta-xylanase
MSVALDAGFPLPPEYAKRVKDGIERYRKGNAIVQVLDENRKPLNGAIVEVCQVSHDFLFGCAFPNWNIPEFSKKHPDVWANFERYFTSLFNYATTENMIKWNSLEPEEGKPNYQMVDAFVTWCQSHNIKIKGHCLVWGLERLGYPKWLEKYSPDEVSAKVEKRIKEVVSRYKGKIDIWDVVNEPLDCHWFETHMEPDYAVKAYKWAREANPQAKLVLNEYGCLWNRKDAKFVDYCQELMKAGAPFDAVGEQAHDGFLIPSPKRFFDVMDSLSRLGKEIHLTEITVPSTGRKVESEFVEGYWTPELHGKYYRYLYTLAFSHPNVKAITLWAMWDGSSWLEQGGIITRDWTPKPAYYELDSLINKEWRTNRSGRTGIDGKYHFRGFYGIYKVKVTYAGKKVSCDFHLSEDSTNAVTIVLR